MEIAVNDFLRLGFKESNNENIKAYKNYISKNEAFLALGAGINKRVGLPQWEGLITELMLQCICQSAFHYNKCDLCSDNERCGINREKQQRNFFDTFFKIANSSPKVFKDINSLESAEYVLKHLEKLCGRYRGDELIVEEAETKTMGKRTLANMVLHILMLSYRKKEITLKEEDKPDWETLINTARLSVAVKHVLTYNYDDGIEKCLTDKNTDYDSKGVRDCNYKDSPKSPVIYHVHGRLPVFGIEECDNDFKDGIILSESSYLNLEWAYMDRINSCQATLFYKRHGLFVGFSRTDNNFRRILQHMSQTDSVDYERRRVYAQENSDFRANGYIPDKPLPTHFILVSINKLIDSLLSDYIKTDKSGNITEKNLYTSEAKARICMMDELLQAQSAYLIQHGLFPIFVTYQDIPLILDSLA